MLGKNKKERKMLETFLIMIQTIAVLFIFIALGYILVKCKVLKENASETLSKICVDVFTSALCFSTMIKCCTIESMTEDITLLVAGLIILAATWFVSYIVSRSLSKNIDTENVYLYSLICSNYGYIGYPIILALMGERALFDFMIFSLPFTVFTYTVAPQILKPGGKISFKGLFTSPPTLALFAGMIIGLSGFSAKIPQFLADFASKAGDCMTPVGMIMIGCVLGKFEIRKLFNDIKAYIVSACRLIVWPFIALLIYYICGIRGNGAVMGVIFLCLPVGMNTVVFPEAYGGDSRSGARIVFLTNVIGIISIPIITAIAKAVLA